MGGRAMFVWDDAYVRYDFGRQHPMRQVRALLSRDLAACLGVLDGMRQPAPTPADDRLLGLVHDLRYVNTLRDDPVFAAGVGPPDNPPFPGMHEAAALIVGGTVTAARAVWQGEVDHAVNLAGGLHHAMRDRASGFCLYNDPAVAIADLLDQGARCVAYVDVDAHHGDGVQAAFDADPRVVTISLHESGEALFPGTGAPTEIGRDGGQGAAVNVALPPGTGDAGWLRAFHAVVPPLLRAVRPQVLVSQCGTDAHRRDPLADLLVSVDAMAEVYAALHALAHEICDGRWVATGGGGYVHADVVPRAWTRLVAEMAGRPLDAHTEVPETWRAEARSHVPYEEPPTVMTDGAPAVWNPWHGGTGDPDDPVDRAIAATRTAIWPLYGLDPLDARD
jgi:acetoin utilization protein AcuC